MKRLKNLTIDGILVAIVTSALAGSSKDYVEYPLPPAIINSINYSEIRLYPAEKNSIPTDSLMTFVNSNYQSLRTSEQKYGIDNEKSDVLNREFFLDIYFTESANKPKVKSNKEAKGIGQIQKDAWNLVEKEYSYDTYVFNPDINIRVSMKYAAFLHDFLKENHPGWNALVNAEKQNLILAAYNGGHGLLQKRSFNISSMPKETRSYVDKQKDGYPIVLETDLYSRVMQDSMAYKNTIDYIYGKINSPIFVPDLTAPVITMSKLDNNSDKYKY